MGQGRERRDAPSQSPPAPRRPPAPAVIGHPALASQPERLRRLQASAGNLAVARLLGGDAVPVQRHADPRPHAHDASGRAVYPPPRRASLTPRPPAPPPRVESLVPGRPIPSIPSARAGKAPMPTTLPKQVADQALAVVKARLAEAHTTARRHVAVANEQLPSAQGALAAAAAAVTNAARSPRGGAAVAALLAQGRTAHLDVERQALEVEASALRAEEAEDRLLGYLGRFDDAAARGSVREAELLLPAADAEVRRAKDGAEAAIAAGQRTVAAARRAGLAAAQSAAETGLARASSRQAYIGSGGPGGPSRFDAPRAGLVDLRLPWIHLTPQERLRRLAQPLEAQLSELGVPAPAIRAANLPYAGVFSAATWTLYVSQARLAQPFDAAVFADLANTLYHECRHCEQNFRIARLLAGRAIAAGTARAPITGRNLAARAVLHGMAIPGYSTTIPLRIAVEAVDRPLAEGAAPSLEVEEAKEWMGSLTGAGRVEGVQKIQEMNARQAAYEANPTQASLVAYHEAIARYRQLPEEADAYRVGDSLEEGLRAELGLPAK